MPKKNKISKPQRLYRSKHDNILGGVCGGLGAYFGVDPTLLRVIWAIASLFSMGLGLLAYLIAWLIIPLEP